MPKQNEKVPFGEKLQLTISPAHHAILQQLAELEGVSISKVGQSLFAAGVEDHALKRLECLIAYGQTFSRWKA